jgi:hypothetical protein
VISVYEVINVFVYGMTANEFEPWADMLIVMNTLLVVFNSAINFAFYCGDVVFRECLATIKITECCRRRKDDEDGGEGGGRGGCSGRVVNNGSGRTQQVKRKKVQFIEGSILEKPLVLTDHHSNEHHASTNGSPQQHRS